MKDENKAVTAVLAGWVGAGLLSFEATSDGGGIADTVVSKIGSGFGMITDVVFGSVGAVLGGLTDSIMSGLFGEDGGGGVFGAMFDLFIKPLEAGVNLVTGIIMFPVKFIGGLFDMGFGLTTMQVTGGVQIGDQVIPGILFVIVAVILSGFGVAIIQGSDGIQGIPLLGDVADAVLEGIGSMLLMLGATLAVYGMWPEYSTFVLGGGFALVFAAGLYTYIMNVQQGGKDQGYE